MVAPVLHRYVYGEVPLYGKTVAAPFDAPQVALVTCIESFKAAEGCVTVPETVEVHKFASVTVTVYVAAVTFTKSDATDAFDHK